MRIPTLDIARLLPFAAAALLSFAAEDAVAQVNAARILREATGTYELVRSGGSLRIDDGESAFSFVPDTVRGSTRIPVASPNPVVRLTSPDLAGNGSSLSKGRRTRAKVSRDGKRIAYDARGTSNEFDGSGPYRGTSKGNFTRRGASWRMALLLNGTQTLDATTVGTVRRMRLRGTR